MKTKIIIINKNFTHKPQIFGISYMQFMINFAVIIISLLIIVFNFNILLLIVLLIVDSFLFYVFYKLNNAKSSFSKFIFAKKNNYKIVVNKLNKYYLYNNRELKILK